MVEFLLNNHAFINARDDTGCTPVYYAIRNGNIKLTRLFFYYKALPWCFTNFGIKFKVLASCK